MASSTQSILNCSIIWQNTMMEERAFPAGRRITVGEDHRATFTLPANLGKKRCLFRPKPNSCELWLQEGMLGRVQIKGRTWEVDELLTDPQGLADRKGQSIVYELEPGDGGVLVFGSVGLAFQLGKAAPALPPSSVGQILGADKTVTRAFGASVALMVMLMLVSRLLGAPGTAFSIEQLPDRFVSFVVDDPSLVKDFKKDLKELEKKQAEEIKKRLKPKRSRPEERRPEKKAVESPADDAETKRIREKVAKKGMVAELSKARRRNSALAHVLNDGGLGMSIDSAMSAMRHGKARARLLTSKGAGGIVVPSLVSRRGSEEALGEGISDAGPKTGRTARRVASGSRLAERAEASLSLPSAASTTVTGGTLSKKAIAKVIMRNKGAIKYCYESQLTRFPTLRGKVVVDFIIEMNGSVRTAKVSSNKLNKAAAKGKVASCLMRFVRRWQFPKPQGGKVRVIYPFTFGRKR